MVKIYSEKINRKRLHESRNKYLDHTLTGILILSNMKEIQLTQGFAALVDDEDFERVNALKWYASKFGNNVYALRETKESGKRTSMLMHRFILNCKIKIDVDHIDGNSLNNSKSNLRLCTHAENLMNQKPQKGKTSIYKGVTFNKNAKKFLCQIMKSNKHIYLGLFVDEVEAAKAYDKKAKELFGKFAWINFP